MIQIYIHYNKKLNVFVSTKGAVCLNIGDKLYGDLHLMNETPDTKRVFVSTKVLKQMHHTVTPETVRKARLKVLTGWIQSLEGLGLRSVNLPQVDIQ